MTAQSWEDLVSQLVTFHMKELGSQREQYEAQLSGMHDEIAILGKEVAMLGDQLKQAKRLIARLDPSISLDDLEAAAEQYQVGVAASGSAGDGAAPALPPDAGRGAARGAPPPAPPPAPLPAEGGPAGETPTAHVPAAADPALTEPPPEAHMKKEPCSGARYLWKVVGGGDAGGVDVQQSEAARSPFLGLRLGTGTLVEEIKFGGDLLHFRRLAGVGPQEGWVRTKHQGKTMVLRLDRAPLKPRQLPPMTVGPHSESPLPIALIFPETPMLLTTTWRNLLRIKLPEVKDKLDKAKEITGFDVYKGYHHFWQGSLVLFLAEVAGLENLKAFYPDVVRRAAVMTGLGIGLYTACVAAGVLSFKDALKLVKLRSELLQEAGELCRQGLTRVTGLDLEALWPLCAEARSMEGVTAICEVTCYVNAKTFFVSGTEGALGLMESMATKSGGQVRRAASVATNSVFFKPFQKRFEAALDEALPNMKPPLCTLWMPCSAEPARPGCDPAEIAAELRHECANPILFHQSHAEMVGEGIKYVHKVSVTLGPPNVFTQWED